MMNSSERLIEGLVDDLTPVRPIPRLRSAFAVILALWAALLGVVLFSSSKGLASGALLHDQVYLASFMGLGLAAVGGALSALAAGVPGRERLEIVGLGTACLGLMAAAIACLYGLQQPPLETSAPAGLDAICFRHGVILSLLPAGVILGFLVRGWTARPFRAVAVALAGSGALGAVIVHLGCGFVGPRHLLVGHLSVPIVLALLGLYPLAVIVRRLRG